MQVGLGCLWLSCAHLSPVTLPPPSLNLSQLATLILSQVLSLRNAVFDLWRQQGGNLSHLGVYMSDNVHPGR